MIAHPVPEPLVLFCGGGAFSPSFAQAGTLTLLYHSTVSTEATPLEDTAEV